MANSPKIDYIHGSVHIKVDLSVFEERVIKAQQWLGDRVLEDCKPIMPLLTGGLQQRSHTESDGRFVVFPGPYGRFLYYGKVMLDPVTGSSWAKYGGKKVPTDIPLNYSRVEAVPEWFEVAKKKNLQYWTDGVARIVGGKK